MKKLWTAPLLGSAAMLLVSVLDASAATIRVKCEIRSNRSQISVDAKDLAPGLYSARVISGANQATADPQVTIGDEVEFDFDSDPANIAAGATPIGANFIQGKQVTGKILNASKATIISDTVNCRVR